MDKIKLELPSNPAYLSVLRLTTGAIVNNLGFDVDKLEDAKVVVSEIYTHLMSQDDEIFVTFEIEENHLTVTFDNKFEIKKNHASDLSFDLKKQILLALADDLIIEEEKISVVLSK